VAGVVVVLQQIFGTRMLFPPLEQWIDVRLLPDLQDKGIEACCSFAKKAPAALVKQAAGEFVGSCLCSSMSFLLYQQ
jgi:hypothetical protein